jgi:uncharacterized protein (TIGR00369 family)
MSDSTDTSPRVTAERFNSLLAETTPLATHLGIKADQIGNGESWSRMCFSAAATRHGGTYSGPALMALIDVSVYAAIMGFIGEDLRPLTTNIAINFLRRPPARDLIAHCKVLNRDCELAVGYVVIYSSDDQETALCTSTCTYAVPD